MSRTIEAALRAARDRLAGTSDSPDLDARRLLEYLLDADASHLIVHGERELTPAEIERFDALLARRIDGEPVAYIVGRIGFWTLELAVIPAVLIPRPDTETLVEVALEILDADAPLKIADLGTGSGAIALALASERPAWSLLATDTSEHALACAHANAQRLALTNICFCRGDWFAPLGKSIFDAIVSNPPYVAPGDPHLRAPDLRHEPQTALVAEDAGLADLALLIKGASPHLVSGGLLLVEHGADQGAEVRALFGLAGFTEVETRHDLGLRERVTLGRSENPSANERE